MVWERQCFEVIFTKDDSLNELINQLMSNGGVCKTALASPGLINILKNE